MAQAKTLIDLLAPNSDTPLAMPHLKYEVGWLPAHVVLPQGHECPQHWSPCSQKQNKAIHSTVYEKKDLYVHAGRPGQNPRFSHVDTCFCAYGGVHPVFYYMHIDLKFAAVVFRAVPEDRAASILGELFGFD